MNGNDTFLDINNAHLRVNNGNVQASTFVLDQIDFIASSNASTTVGFNNPTSRKNSQSSAAKTSKSLAIVVALDLLTLLIPVA